MRKMWERWCLWILIVTLAPIWVMWSAQKSLWWLFFFVLLVIRVSVLSAILSITLPLVLLNLFSWFHRPQSPSTYRETRWVVAVLYLSIMVYFVVLVCFHSIQNHNLSVFMAGGKQNMGAFYAKSSRNLCWRDAVFSRFLRDLHVRVSRTRSRLRIESAFSLQRLL